MLEFITSRFKKNHISTSESDEVSTCYTVDANTDNRIVVDLKHEIDDTVWVADYFYDTFYPCKYPGKIEEIEIKVTSKRRNVYYWISIHCEDKISFETYPEAMCFSSYEECARWCEEYNSRSSS